MIRFLLVALLLIGSPPAVADTITGVPRIVDGDRLVINGLKIRLHGIDAPERNQTCGTDPNRWDCGRQATRALTEMINRAPVICHERDVDRYGRIVASKAQADERARKLEGIVMPLRENGESLQMIADTLTAAGCETPRGGAWHPISVKRFIARLEPHNAAA